MPKTIVCLPGDGIGPEVMGQALQAIAALPLELEVAEYAFGGAAIDAYGEPLPASTLEACRAADAVLLGAVGGPQWEGGQCGPRSGLIGLRKELDAYANLRPALGQGVDLVIVRELVGGLYYGARGTRAGRHRLRHLRVPPRPGRADRAARLRDRALPQRAAPLGRQGQRARHLAHVAPRRHRGRAPSTPTSSCATASSTASPCSSSWTRTPSTCS